MAPDGRKQISVYIEDVAVRPPSCRSADRCYTSNCEPLAPPSNGIGVEMLDAYIIERIRREREARQSQRERVQISIPDEGPRDHHREEMERRSEPRREETPSRGITIIDFTI
jgi:hypothetical protein